MYKDTTIIIPTLNEEKNISKLIIVLNKLYPGVKITVSDDGSRDKTQEVAKKLGAKVIDRSKEKVKGLTASVVDAVKKIKTKYFVVVDADFQHPPEKIKEIIDKLKTYDVVGGRRISEKGWSFKRKLISKTAMALGKIRLIPKKFKIKDMGSGFFGAKTDVFKEVLRKKENKFEMKGYKVFFDLLKYLPDHTTVAEIEYDFQMRKEGESKLGKKHIFYYLKSLFK